MDQRNRWTASPEPPGAQRRAFLGLNAPERLRFRNESARFAGEF